MLKQRNLERKVLKTFPPKGEGLYPSTLAISKKSLRIEIMAWKTISCN